MTATFPVEERLGEFRRRWPEIGSHVVPELAEVLVRLDRPRWIARVIGPLLEGLSRLFYPIVAILLVLSCWGIFLLIFLLLFRMVFPRRRAQPEWLSVPCLSQRIIKTKGYLGLECSMAALSCRQIAATEAATAWMLRSGTAWFRAAFFAALWLCGMLIALNFYTPRQWEFWVCAFCGIVMLVSSARFAEEMQLIKRLGMAYDACSIDAASHAFLSRVKPKSRNLDDGGTVLAALMFFGIVAFSGLLFAIVMRQPMTLLVALSLWAPVFAFIISKNTADHVFRTMKDGERRFAQLVAHLARQTR